MMTDVSSSSSSSSPSPSPSPSRKRSRRVMVFVLLLPEEVLIDKILLKLPVKSLLKLRCVSRYFWNLITSPSFVSLHLQQQQTPNNNNIHCGNSLLLISTRYDADCVYDDGISRASIDVIHNYICNFSSSSSSSSSATAESGSGSGSESEYDPSRPEIVEMNCPFENTDIRASCNGLLYLHGRWIHGKWSQGIEGDIIKSPSYIWNPCTKEYKEVPSPPPSTLLKDQEEVHCNGDSCGDNCSTGFCGFGYDPTNDQYKILYYEHLVENSGISFTALFNSYRAGTLEELLASTAASATSTTEYKLYTLGTNTWTTITHNPYRSLYFGHQWQRIGMLVKGALHWIMSSDISSRSATKSKIIAFDMDKEVFQEVQKPPLLLHDHDHEDYNYNYNYYGNLQVLQGCLCVCLFPLQESNNEVDIWMLKDYAVKDSWTKLFRVVLIPAAVDCGRPEPKVISERYFKLLPLCENGEIVMMRHREDLVVYDPINHKVRRSEKFEEAVKKYWNYQMDYTESLVSLKSGTYNTNTNAVGKKIQVLRTLVDKRYAGRDSYLYSRLFVKS